MKSGYRFLAVSLVAASVFPCAVDTSPRFTPLRHPEKFQDAFVRGELGILPSTLNARYKLIAWRYLSGLPLTTEEQAEMSPRGLYRGPDDAIGKWQTARRLVAGINNVYISPSKASKHAYYENCHADAFRVASETLYERVKLGNAIAQSWLAAQDQVFQNCSSNIPIYPSDPGAGLTPLARADRLYQIAAAHFYAEDLDGALRRFRDIAAETGSPWRATANYMVARTLVREGSLLHKSDAFAQATAQLETIAEGPLHDDARNLIAYVKVLSDPTSALQQIAANLTGPDFPSALDECAFALTSTQFQEALTKQDLPEPLAWSIAIESGKTPDLVARWRKTGSLLWLTAALIHAKPEDGDAKELIAAAAKISDASPAFDTVNYNALRLMIATGQKDSARRRLDQLLSRSRRKLDSVDNAFREQRMSLATNYDDFIRFAVRRPIGIAEEDADPGVVNAPATLGYDSVTAFNSFTPLSKLAAAARSNRLPPGIRSQIAIEAWTRAFILEDNTNADAVALLLAKAKPNWTTDLESFRNAPASEKRFAGALLIARHADFKPDLWLAFSPDWWCAEPLQGGPGKTIPPLALTNEERRTAATELRRLHDSGAAQTFLASIVMSFAAEHPDDQRVPEALYRLVRVTRYGCRQVEGNGKLSKAAFDLLHTRYPNTNWARQTPYWFDK